MRTIPLGKKRELLSVMIFGQGPHNRCCCLASMFQFLLFQAVRFRHSPPSNYGLLDQLQPRSTDRLVLIRKVIHQRVKFPPFFLVPKDETLGC